jgi:hypothetical protein
MTGVTGVAWQTSHLHGCGKCLAVTLMSSWLVERLGLQSTMISANIKDDRDVVVAWRTRPQRVGCGTRSSPSESRAFDELVPVV